MSIARPSRRLGLLLAVALLAVPFIASADGFVRLSQDVAPTFQSLRLVLDADKADYTGSTHIDVMAKKAVRTFQFHWQGDSLVSASMSGKGGAIPVKFERLDEATYTVTSATDLAPGPYGLDMQFANHLDTRAVGLYKVVKGGKGYTFTQFEDTEARKSFPCWDEPCFKQPWQITLVVPVGHMALSNTPIAKETTEGAMKTVVFARSKPLPSYLVALATGPFQAVDIPGMGFPGRVITVQGDISLAAEAVSATPKLIKALEAEFGRPYPYEKLDLIAVPEFNYGAMENAGLITFREAVLLNDPKNSSAEERRHQAYDIAHELAHMWFGDLVTMAWWDDLWLNESFATWMGEKVADQVFPQYGIGLSQVRSSQRAMATDGTLSTRAIREPVKDANTLSQMADALAYDKGKAVLQMFERWMGEETFRKGVVQYLNAHEWGNATASDLWAALSAACGKDLSGPLSTYLDQPGVPRVDVEALPGGKIRLTQSRFLPFGSKAPTEQLWSIPIRLKYSDGKTVQTRNLMLDTRSQELELAKGGEVQWVVPNAGESGYYRWSVPGPMLVALAQQSRTVLADRERAAFLGNCSAMLNAGLMHSDDYLRTLAAFADDPNPQVITSVANGLNVVENAFVTPDLDPAFDRYVRATLGPALKRFNMRRQPGEDEQVSLLRPELLAWMGHRGHDEAVLAYADSMAREYNKDPELVDPAIAGTMVRLSCLKGDRAMFLDYRARFEGAKLPAQRAVYLGALGSFQNPAIVEEALQYALNGPLRPQELFTIPMVVGGNSQKYEMRLWDWITSNYATLVGKMPPMFVAFMPQNASGCSEKKLELAKAFFSEASHQAPGTLKQLARVSERVGTCVGLRQREGAAAAAYLNGKVGAKE